MSTAEPVPLPGVQGVDIDQTAMRGHVIEPRHVMGTITDTNPQHGDLPSAAQLAGLTGTHLDIAAFGAKLHTILQNSVVGYTMQLRKGGVPVQTRLWNWAKKPADGGLGWTLDRQIHIASVSKLITAMAMTKLLDDKHLSYDAPIINCLPTYWTKGSGVEKITFRHLMTHTSGFVTGSTQGATFSMMKTFVGQKVNNVGTMYNYENMNYSLCRILIPVINGNIAANTTFPPIPFGDPNPKDDSNWDYITIQAYDQYVRKAIFVPAGVTKATLGHPTDAALAYGFPLSGSGWNSGDLSTTCGGDGWHMSVNEVLNIMGTFRRTGTILAKDRAQAMLDNSFGVDGPVTLTTPAGTLYNKNGYWGDALPGRAEQCVAYFLPEDMELIVVANSPIGLSGTVTTLRDTGTNVYLSHLTTTLASSTAEAAAPTGDSG